MKQAVQAYLETMHHHPGEHVYSSELYAGYLRWCSAMGHAPSSHTLFSIHVSETGLYVREKSSRIRFVRSIPSKTFACRTCGKPIAGLDGFA